MKAPHLRRVVVASAVTFVAVRLWSHSLTNLEPEPENEEEHAASDVGVADTDIFEARPGDLLLFNRATGLNQIITWFTKSKYYHVGIYEGEGKVVEARPRGVVRRDLNGPDGDKYFDVIPAENVATREAAQEALAWAQTQLGDGYDPFNVLSIVLDRTFSCYAWNASLPHHWSCGEFVAAAFDNAGVKLFDKPDAAVAPVDFEKFL